VLRNHGIAVGERDIPNTFFLLWVAQRAAEIQCQTGMIPGADIVLKDEIRNGCARDAARLTVKAGAAKLMFDAEVRRMRKARGALWDGDRAG
jgi:ribulose-5-phosphate 4-epimerase/fuculose-1-phosphate aldolase